jgi:hypothetical protein
MASMKWTNVAADLLADLRPCIDIAAENTTTKAKILAKYAHCCTLRDWDRIKVEFLVEVRASKFITVDTESIGPGAKIRLRRRRNAHLKGNPITPAQNERSWEDTYNFNLPALQNVYVIMGTVSGKAVTLDLRWLRHTSQQQDYEAGVAALLPVEILDIFGDSGIIKVGAGLYKDYTNDFQPEGIVFKSLLDIGPVMKELVPTLYADMSKLVARYGRGSMSIRIYGFNYKPDQTP